MSALPRHKKSPAELAKLRETLGIPPDPGPPVDPATPANPAPPAATNPPVDLPTAHGPRHHHSLKRSERIEPPAPEPVLVAQVPVLEAPGGGIEHLAVPPPETVATHEPKPIRSLKRSERMGGPVSLPQQRPTPIDSRLPGHRHSTDELLEIRRRSAAAAIAEGGYLPPQAAATPLLVTGYVLAIGGAAAPTLLKLLAKLTDSYNLGLALSGGYHLLVVGALAALPIAVFIYLKKTLSRHHAAFIAVTALFALIFATLHYFSQLLYGT